MAELDDLVREFLVESNENLDRLDQDFVALEQDASATDRLASIFRTIHTIKGTCGFLGFSKLESVTHIGENLLSRLRDGEIGVSSEIVTALLRMVDAVREILGSIESGQGEGDGDYTAIIETLTALKNGGGAGEAAPEPEGEIDGVGDALISGGEPAEAAAQASDEIDLSSLPFDGELTADGVELATGDETAEVVSEDNGDVSGVSLEALMQEAGLDSGEAGHDDGAPVAEAAPVAQVSAAASPAPTAPTPTASAPAVPAPKAMPAPESGSSAGAAGSASTSRAEASGSEGPAGGGETGSTPPLPSSTASSGIRVDVGLLDKLMNLVGELVLARNQILQYSATAENAMLSGSTQRLNLITTELQEGVMKTRMQPIGNVWSKFPRIVRDLSQMCGKKVRVEMEGRDTELDKTIIEAIKDPLTHIIRNSVDHGIETPEKRVAAGKPEEGLLYLRAFHEGGQVNIEIIDDGAGINVERVKQRAVERGMISADQAARMGEREAANLIFAPGFSTAEKVTNVSGRGVGMDVVKTNIEKIGGTVDLQSRFGQGTTLRIKIPLTLAIIPALVVTSGGDRFAIPQVSLLELVRVEGREASQRIEQVHGTPVYRLRGRLLPLVYLSKELGRNGAPSSRGGTVAGIDFAVAREKHLNWRRTLREFLDGKAELTLEKAATHRDCALGKWIYGEGQAEFGGLAEFRSLESLHMQMHNAVRDAIVAKDDKRGDDAEECLRSVSALSEQIIALLDRMERVAGAGEVNIVVLQADGRQFGLVVDEINDTEEIVVKPLGKVFKGLATFAGATIMGDGRVALILDVMGLAQRAGVVREGRERSLHESGQKGESSGGTRQTLLLFRVSDTHRMAIPLSMVARLEEFPRDLVEMSGEQPVIQYRGGIMPLVPLGQVLGYAGGTSAAEGAGESIQVIVVTRGEQSIGLVVDRIVDIVEQSVSVKRTGVRSGVIGSAVIEGKVTELLDVEGVVRSVAQDGDESWSGVPAGEGRGVPQGV